jgi:thioredoxin-related protein
MRSVLLALLLMPLLALAGASEHAPKGTFAESFLDFPDEVRDAAKARRRVIVFFEQEGCPACLRMAKTTFVDAAVTERLKQRFVLVAIDLFGSRDTVWLDGVPRAEKALAAQLGVRATPTVMILDEQGKTVQQFIGYRDPRAFQAILDAGVPR